MEGEKEVLNALSGHQKRAQHKKVREEAHERKDEEHDLKQRKKNYFWIIITIIAIVGFAVIVMWLYKSKPQMYTDREVHWHAAVELSICGEKIDLPCGKETPGTVHGKDFCGEHIMHHHFDNTIHIEGLIQKKEDIALGKFFDIISVPFDKDKILDKKNGDLCPDGKPGKLKMYVNDQPREDFRDYVPIAVQDARKQVIKLVFEPEETANASS